MTAFVCLTPDSVSSLKKRARLFHRITPSFLEVLSHDNNPEYRSWVARNINLTFETAMRLSDDPDETVKVRLAKCTSFLEIVYKLSFDSISDVRYAVANNKHTPSDILLRLVYDEKGYVSNHAIGNPNMPSNELEKLSDKVDPNLRFWVAGNPSTPISVLRKFLSDVDEYVRDRAAKILNDRIDSERF